MLNILGVAEGEEGGAAAKAVLDKAYATPGRLLDFVLTVLPARMQKACLIDDFVGQSHYKFQHTV